MQNGSPLKLLTVPEAAQALRVSQRKMEMMVRTGEMPSLIIGARKRFIRECDVLGYVEQRLAARNTAA